MTEYIMKLGFWLRAYDSITIQANSDAAAIEAAKVAAKRAMESVSQPEHIDTDDRREGIIAYIDRVTADSREQVIEAVPFDEDRIHPQPGG